MQNISSVLRKKIFKRHDFQFQELESEYIDGQRYYMTPTGEKYPSVTTVLSSLSKDGIKKWRQRVGEEAANKIVKQAASRGTQLHNMCEKYMLNIDNFAEKSMPLIIEMFKSIQPYIDRVDEVYGNEIPLFSHDLKTAGRSDLFCSINNRKCILDFKSSSKPKKEEWIESYFLQATTYAMMIRELTEIEVPKLAILIAVEGDQPQFFIKNTKEYEDKVRELFFNYHINKGLYEHQGNKLY